MMRLFRKRVKTVPVAEGMLVKSASPSDARVAALPAIPAETTPTPHTTATFQQGLRLAVLNIKGGSGKSTVATTLAAHYARHDDTVALIDHDPIAISLSWARQRPEDVPVIHAVDASSNSRRGHNFNWRTRVPVSVSLQIADTPGGVNSQQLREILDWADLVLVPVLPSSIDIRAASRFMGEVLRHPAYRQQRHRVAVIANRVTQWTGMHYKLDRFLNTLGIPFLATITESENYAKAYEQSLGLGEIYEDVDALIEEWQAVFDWIAEHRANPKQPSVKTLAS